MNESIKNICDLMMENRKLLKDEMTWTIDANTNAVMAGFITAAKDYHGDVEKYKACRKILHDKAGYFSELRGLAESVVITKMMNSDNPTAYIDGVKAVYDKLCSLHKFTSSSCLPLAAMNIFERSGVEGSDDVIEKLEELYKKLKEEHPILISDADRSFLSLLALSDADVPQLAENVEKFYDACKDMSVMEKDAIHSMAQIMALSDSLPEEKAEFANALLQGLKDKKLPANKKYVLPAIGALSLTGVKPEQLLEDVSDVYNYMNGNDGFKWYDTNKESLTMYAMLIVFLYYAKEKASIVSQIGSSIAVSISEEILFIFIIIALSIH